MVKSQMYMSSMFPSTNGSSGGVLHSVARQKQLSITAAPVHQWLPTDLMTCTFVAVDGLCIAFLFVRAVLTCLTQKKEKKCYYKYIIMVFCATVPRAYVLYSSDFSVVL